MNSLIDKVDSLVTKTGKTADKVIPLLQAIQKEFNYLPPEALERVCETTDITPAVPYTGYPRFILSSV